MKEKTQSQPGVQASMSTKPLSIAQNYKGSGMLEGKVCTHLRETCVADNVFARALTFISHAARGAVLCRTTILSRQTSTRVMHAGGFDHWRRLRHRCAHEADSLTDMLISEEEHSGDARWSTACNQVCFMFPGAGRAVAVAFAREVSCCSAHHPACMHQQFDVVIMVALSSSSCRAPRS